MFRVFTFEAKIMLIIMGLGSCYNTYKNYKYSDCEIEKFTVLDTTKDNEIAISAKLPHVLERQKIYVKIKDFPLPYQYSSSMCEKAAYSNIKHKLLSVNSDRSRKLFLKKCQKENKFVDGYITTNNKNILLSLYQKKEIPLFQKQTFWERLFRYKKIVDWCEVVQ